ncbi:MAG: hypothetical protein EOO43_25885 [Flavobacterium sp.]|nr:MAG: hypothetical protein EOO43_25885 [Flavobacterium sp.]
MLNTQELQTSVLEIGEDIGYELGKKMVHSFQSLNPTEIPSFLIGRKILTHILNQPSCEGIRIYHGYNEIGERTLVYVGVDEYENNIFEVTSITPFGNLTSSSAIVGDRVKPGGLPTTKPGGGGGLASPDDWEWVID